MSSEVVLHAKGVSKTYAGHGGSGTVHALIDVDLTVQRGQTLGLVGESGSGKTTLTRMLLNLEKPSSGEVSFEGRRLQDLGGDERRRYRHAVAAVFQNPYSSLDPRMRIWDAITEQQAIERTASKSARRERAKELLEIVGLGGASAQRYPHQLSGGQRQRVAIARAIAQDPEVIILDEPLSALDVSVSAQIVNLLLDLQDRLGVTYVFVGHDLRLVRHLCHDIAVMYQGRIVEQGESQRLLDSPSHPYTAALVAASELTTLANIVDDGDTTARVEDVTVGCPYRPRCPRSDELCAIETPASTEKRPQQWARCHHPLVEGPLVGATGVNGRDAHSLTAPPAR